MMQISRGSKMERHVIESGTIGVVGAVPGKYLTFLLSNDRYGINLLKVQEIIKVPQITFVPRCVEYIKGVINLRGKIIPVVDLRTKFGLPPRGQSNKSCVIVIDARCGDSALLVGVIVDTVLEVLHFSQNDISAPPNYGSKLESLFVTGMVTRDDAVNVIIDIDAIIASVISSSGRQVLPQNV